ncbi:MAG: hypothetical protein CME71_11295 [Halobacteriovorax sp.]|nr:hypothetical protein [Halobacteriovorax sp.]
MILENKKQDGSVSYKVKVYVNGRQVTKTFRRKSDAKLWKQQMIVDRERGFLKLENPEASQTLRDFSVQWFQTKVIGKSPKTQSSYRIQLEHHILPHLGDFKLKELKISLGHDLISKLRAKNKSPKGINMALGVLKSMLNDAVRWEVLELNPFRNIVMEKIRPTTPKFWMPEEVNQFLAANKACELYELWIVALNTGMRRGELAGVKWDKLDFRNKLIHVARLRDRTGLRETTKTRSSFRYVPMNEASERAMLKLQEQARHPEYVFAHKNGQMIDVQHISERHFKRAIKRAGVKPIRFHDLRGTFASNVCMAPGGDLFGLSKILGHSNVDMTVKRYAHLHNSFLKQVAASVNFTGDDV